tara:strand:- start:415 stop:660 length:246 start_codon:yes stop_codon:yes gene_type:complete
MNVNELGDNRYDVTSHGNIFHSKATLVKDIEAKAVKLCGVGNYDIVGDSTMTKSRYTVRTGGVNAPSGANFLSRTIECKNK